MYATPYDKHFYYFLTDDSGKVCTYLYLYETYNIEPNHIKFVGPGIPAIRLIDGKLIKEKE
ncbi:MAG: hypothetical protein J7K47_01005 [Thermoplasmata archaeon]|nr:hypothetical protein [Thermoplasmata archaeon]